MFTRDDGGGMEEIHVPSLYRVIAKMRYCFSPGRNLVNCWYDTGTKLDMDQGNNLDKIYVLS